MNAFLQKSCGLGTLLVAAATSAQNYSIDSFCIDSGGGISRDGVFAVSGTIRRPEAEPMTGGGYAVSGELQSIIAAPATDDNANPSTTIFDNTGGSSNGYESATPNNWLAEKFCVGTQSYSLDSLTLLLVSGDNNGEPRLRTVRLRIYSNDPVAGKPAVDTGVIMNLAEATNPITLPISFTEAPIKWKPAARFILAPNQCYWAVLSTDIGIVSEPASSTMPTGDAASLGRASSPDAGVTWPNLDPGTTRKMLIQGTASPAPQELTITAVSLSGTELRFSFPATAGRSYVIESRPDLAAGAWAEVPGTRTTSSGATLQLIVPIALAQPQEFYRVRMLP